MFADCDLSHSNITLFWANQVAPPFTTPTVSSGFPSKKSDVDLGHHLQRIEFVTEASDFPDFLKRKDAPGTLWPDIETSAAASQQIRTSRTACCLRAVRKI